MKHHCTPNPCAHPTQQLSLPTHSAHSHRPLFAARSRHSPTATPPNGPPPHCTERTCSHRSPLPNPVAAHRLPSASHPTSPHPLQCCNRGHGQGGGWLVQGPHSLGQQHRCAQERRLAAGQRAQHGLSELWIVVLGSVALHGGVAVPAASLSVHEAEPVQQKRTGFSGRRCGCAGLCCQLGGLARFPGTVSCSSAH